MPHLMLRILRHIQRTAVAVPLLANPAYAISGSPPDLVINEIMYAPTSPEPEWIELINRGSGLVNLKKWQISDATATRHLLPAGDILLPPGAFLILTKDSMALHEARGALPCAVINVSGFPSLNNGGDALVLCDAQGYTVDSLAYRPEWGGSGDGRSLERRDVDGFSTEPDNWGPCFSVARATPGCVNSIVRCSYDLSVAAAFIPGSGVDTVLAVVRNEGKRPASGFTVLVYDDMNLDSLVAPDELQGTFSPPETLLPGGSLPVPLRLILSSGFHQLIAVADLPADERPENNQALCTAMRAFPGGALLVNEIMAEPAPGKSEYLELVNASGRDIDLKGWSVTDLTGPAGRVQISSSARILHPGELLVLAADSTLLKQFPALASMDPRLVMTLHGGRLSLNNDADAVVIHDALDVTIDSVLFSVTWHNPDLSEPGGRSLERISTLAPSNDPRNWNTSVDPSGGTPGMRNSISVASVPVASRLSCAPNPFSPDGDGLDDMVVIHYEMPLQISIINLKIYDIRGRLIRRLASNEPGGPVGNIIWDGRDETGAVARVGMYIALLEAVNSSGAIESAKGVLVLARRL